MKRIVSVFYVALMCASLCLSLACCSQGSEAHSGFQIMSSDINDFVIEAPKDWIITSQNGFASATAQGIGGDLSNISATSFEMLEEVKNPEQYFEHAVTKPFGEGHSLNVIERDVGVKLGEQDAKKYVYSLDMYGEKYKYMMVICAYNGRIYVVTYTSTEEFYDRYTVDNPYMTDILNFFKFKV